MKLYDPGFSSLLLIRKYTIIQAPTGSGKTWDLIRRVLTIPIVGDGLVRRSLLSIKTPPPSLLLLKKLAKSQAQKEETMSIETNEVTPALRMPLAA